MRLSKLTANKVYHVETLDKKKGYYMTSQKQIDNTYKVILTLGRNYTIETKTPTRFGAISLQTKYRKLYKSLREE
jgi:hypothetical protein